MAKKATALLFLLLSGACATFRPATKQARQDFYSGDYADAAKNLEKKAAEDGKDQLLYLLDRGMALQLAGEYKDSEKDWILADHLTEVKDYTSLSTEAATLFTNDTIEQYKGEDFEKVLINAFLAIDYAVEGNYEDALVECRRVNEKLYKYKYEAKRNYEQNPFARYLSAMIWEASGHPDDAYIDYKNTEELEPEFNYLKWDLMRLARKLGRGDDLKEWKERYGSVNVPGEKEDSRAGEVIVIFQQGKTAIKKPNPDQPDLPAFFLRATATQRARVEVVDAGTSEMTYQIFSISDVAIKTLRDAYTLLAAKKAAGVAAKYLVAREVSKKNEWLGLLTWVGMNAADRADLRQWDTLPETIQLARLHIQPGGHTIKVVGLDVNGNPTGEEKTFQIRVEAGQKVFLNWRSLR